MSGWAQNKQKFNSNQNKSLYLLFYTQLIFNFVINICQFYSLFSPNTTESIIRRERIDKCSPFV